MTPPPLQRVVRTDFDELLEVLTTRQHLAPHESIGNSLARSVGELGVCRNAVEESLKRLQLDPAKSIGRLRRTELMQLARTVHRHWQQAVKTAEASHPQP